MTTLLNDIIPLDYDLKKFEIALQIADSLRIRTIFWEQILESADFQNANNQASLAIKTALETKLMNNGPSQTIEIFKQLLLDRNSTWDTLNVASINNESIGMELTNELKAELVSLLNNSAKTFLKTLSKELNKLSKGK